MEKWLVPIWFYLSVFFRWGRSRLTLTLNGQKSPKAYIEALLDVHKKSVEVVNTCFRGEAGFVASLDKVQLLFGLDLFSQFNY